MLKNLDPLLSPGRARSAFAIVATGETRLYGNVLLIKGVIRP